MSSNENHDDLSRQILDGFCKAVALMFPEHEFPQPDGSSFEPLSSLLRFLRTKCWISRDWSGSQLHAVIELLFSSFRELSQTLPNPPTAPLNDFASELASLLFELEIARGQHITFTNHEMRTWLFSTLPKLPLNHSAFLLPMFLSELLGPKWVFEPRTASQRFPPLFYATEGTSQSPTFNCAQPPSQHTDFLSIQNSTKTILHHFFNVFPNPSTHPQHHPITPLHQLMYSLTLSKHYNIPLRNTLDNWLILLLQFDLFLNSPRDDGRIENGLTTDPLDTQKTQFERNIRTYFPLLSQHLLTLSLQPPQTNPALGSPPVESNQLPAKLEPCPADSATRSASGVRKQPSPLNPSTQLPADSDYQVNNEARRIKSRKLVQELTNLNDPLKPSHSLLNNHTAENSDLQYVLYPKSTLINLYNTAPRQLYNNPYVTFLMENQFIYSLCHSPAQQDRISTFLTLFPHLFLSHQFVSAPQNPLFAPTVRRIAMSSVDMHEITVPTASSIVKHSHHNLTTSHNQSWLNSAYFILFDPMFKLVYETVVKAGNPHGNIVKQQRFMSAMQTLGQKGKLYHTLDGLFTTNPSSDFTDSMITFDHRANPTLSPQLQPFLATLNQQPDDIIINYLHDRQFDALPSLLPIAPQIAPPPHQQFTTLNWSFSSQLPYHYPFALRFAAAPLNRQYTRMYYHLIKHLEMYSVEFLLWDAQTKEALDRQQQQQLQQQLQQRRKRPAQSCLDQPKQKHEPESLPPLTLNYSQINNERERCDIETLVEGYLALTFLVKFLHQFPLFPTIFQNILVSVPDYISSVHKYCNKYVNDASQAKYDAEVEIEVKQQSATQIRLPPLASGFPKLPQLPRMPLTQSSQVPQIPQQSTQIPFPSSNIKGPMFYSSDSNPLEVHDATRPGVTQLLDDNNLHLMTAMLIRTYSLLAPFPTASRRFLYTMVENNVFVYWTPLLFNFVSGWGKFSFTPIFADMMDELSLATAAIGTTHRQSTAQPEKAQNGGQQHTTPTNRPKFPPNYTPFLSRSFSASGSVYRPSQFVTARQAISQQQKNKYPFPEEGFLIQYITNSQSIISLQRPQLLPHLEQGLSDYDAKFEPERRPNPVDRLQYVRSFVFQLIGDPDVKNIPVYAEDGSITRKISNLELNFTTVSHLNTNPTAQLPKFLPFQTCFNHQVDGLFRNMGSRAVDAHIALLLEMMLSAKLLWLMLPPFDEEFNQ